MKDRCEHGAIRNEPWPEGYAWMEATGTCSCCGTVFCCMFGHVPEDRCSQCGGREMTLSEALARHPSPEPEPKPKTLAERLEEYKQHNQTKVTHDS